MAVKITAALVFALYLLAVPVKLALCFRSYPKPDFAAGFALFEERFARRGAQERLLGEKKRVPWKKLRLDSQKIHALPALKYLLRHATIEHISLTGSIGMENAAATALICGASTAAAAAVAPLSWGNKIELALSADFSGKPSRICFSGMISIRIGHIICAALIAAIQLVSERTSQWKSIRLKTL